MSVTEKCSSENYENISLFIDNEVCKSVYLKCIIILIDFFILFIFFQLVFILMFIFYFLRYNICLRTVVLVCL